MKVRLTEKKLLEIESSVAELRNGKYATKFSLMVRKATAPIVAELRDWYETMSEKREEFGEKDPKTGAFAVKPGTPKAEQFEAEARDALNVIAEFDIPAIPVKDFEEYVPEVSATMLDNLLGIIINDGSDPVDMSPKEKKGKK